MFRDTSRYAKVAREEARARGGRVVTALRLRRLPATNGAAHAVEGQDRLDVLAHARYGDGTRFWHIADANSALDARTLTAEAGATIEVPED